MQQAIVGPRRAWKVVLGLHIEGEGSAGDEDRASPSRRSSKPSSNRSRAFCMPHQFGQPGGHWDRKTKQSSTQKEITATFIIRDFLEYILGNHGL